jgi:phage-related protein
MAQKEGAGGEKPLYWVGSSKSDLLAFAEPVRRKMGMPSASRNAEENTRGQNPEKARGLASSKSSRTGTEIHFALYTL